MTDNDFQELKDKLMKIDFMKDELIDTYNSFALNISPFWDIYCHRLFCLVGSM